VRPLLTAAVDAQLRATAGKGADRVDCSLDLGRSTTTVEVAPDGWTWQGRRYPFLDKARERTVYYWAGESFEPVSRYTTALVKLVPTDWGPPTFEIDGIKMLPTAKVSPVGDAERKVALVEPRGKVVLDTCGGLGYFAAACLAQGASRILSFEKNPDVLWLRSLNPWSPADDARLELRQADVVAEIAALPDASVDAILHDPPRFGIAGELYALAFYRELARVLKRKGRLFHYTGTPNRLTTGRDLPREVTGRLQRAGFAAAPEADGVLAVRN
jgi:predicted methyltransferase